MKKKRLGLILALCLLMSSAVVNAAPVPDWTSDSICTAVASATLYTSNVKVDETGKYVEERMIKTDTFSYESGGKRLQHIIYDENGKSAVNTVYEYDGITSEEMILTSIKKYKNGRNLFEVENVVYDDITGISTYSKYDAEGNFISKTIYTSDDFGRDILAEVFDIDGTLIEYTEIGYNDFGKKQFEKTTKAVDGWFVMHQYEYDDAGVILKEIISENNVNTTVMIYESDTNGNWIRKEVFVTTNGNIEKVNLKLSEVVYRLVIPYGWEDL